MCQDFSLKHFRCLSMRIYVCMCNVPKKRASTNFWTQKEMNHLPTINFQDQTASFREGFWTFHRALEKVSEVLKSRPTHARSSGRSHRYDPKEAPSSAGEGWQPGNGGWLFEEVSKKNIIAWGYPRSTNSGGCEGFFSGALHKNEQIRKFHWLVGGGYPQGIAWMWPPLIVTTRILSRFFCRESQLLNRLIYHDCILGGGPHPRYSPKSGCSF